MGDTGSLTLGFLMAALSIESVSKTFATVAILVPILALGLPVVDTLVVMMVRLTGKGRGHIGRRVVGMFRADREHLHHVLERVVADRKRIVVGIYSLVFVFCALGLVAVVTKSEHLGISLLVVELLVVLGVRLLVSLQPRSKTVGAEQSLNVQEFAKPQLAQPAGPGEGAKPRATTGS